MKIAELSNCTTTLIWHLEFLWEYLVIQGYGAGAPELDILPEAGVQNEKQESELSLNI